ncbi:hypothetical protein BU23DRAFT_564497 [Bimuria novae-zelandiae CBS 107.79]|uniref:Uncharacterized protein n=1 Tax=Bimuria novae-zelandiae CBS 107.79 TaxID=1447943 RepID=A0A6A5VLR5_9PLEO|nr:hypothetical protein BU23DRAFT_564497 [Bimuria novae-zelandiae CBS 107.79]
MGWAYGEPEQQQQQPEQTAPGLLAVKIESRRRGGCRSIDGICDGMGQSSATQEEHWRLNFVAEGRASHRVGKIRTGSGWAAADGPGAYHQRQEPRRWIAACHTGLRTSPSVLTQMKLSLMQTTSSSNVPTACLSRASSATLVGRAKASVSRPLSLQGRAEARTASMPQARSAMSPEVVVRDQPPFAACRLRREVRGCDLLAHAHRKHTPTVGTTMTRKGRRRHASRAPGYASCHPQPTGASCSSAPEACCWKPARIHTLTQ